MGTDRRFLWLLTMLGGLGAGSGCASDPLPAGGLDRPVSAAGRETGADRAAILDPLGPATVAVERQPWSFVGMQGQLISTPSFDIRTTLHNSDTLDRLPRFYEGCLHHYTTALGPLQWPQEPLQTYIFRDERQWRNKTREMLPEQAGAFMTLGRGGFTTRGTAVLYYIGRRDTFAIAAHEGWHQYTQSTFKHSLPTWLEEGVATYMEAIWFTRDMQRTRLRPWNNQERRDALRRAVQEDRIIPFRDLLNKDPQSFLSKGKNRLLVYYAQVWALTRFLAEGEGGRYRPNLEILLADAAEGRLVGRLVNSRVAGINRRRGVLRQSRSGPAVLLEYFNEDLAELDREYQMFVRELVSHRVPGHTSLGTRSAPP